MNSILVSPSNSKEFQLLSELLQKMHIKYYAISNSKDELIDSEDWKKLSELNLSRAYSENEPEYSLDMVKEPNIEYTIDEGN